MTRLLDTRIAIGGLVISAGVPSGGMEIQLGDLFDFRFISCGVNRRVGNRYVNGQQYAIDIIDVFGRRRSAWWLFNLLFKPFSLLADISETFLNLQMVDALFFTLDFSQHGGLIIGWVVIGIVGWSVGCY